MREEDRAPSSAGRVQLVLGVIAFAAALVLVVTGMLNRSLQAKVGEGQARLASAQAAANVNNSLIRLLAKSAAETNDPQLRGLLAQNGITYQAAAAPAAPAPGAAPAVAPAQ